MSEQKYQAIVFDFGNIFMRLDYEVFFNRFSELMGYTFNRETVSPDLMHAMKQHEMGLLSNEDWVKAFQVIKPELTKQQVFEAWNKLLVGVPKHHFEFLKELEKKYRLFLLSNINAVHEAWIDDYMKKEHGVEDFKTQYFEEYFYSHHIHLRKPNKNIYTHVEAKLNESGVTDFLFIDDMEENVIGAREAGWKAVQHNPTDDIVEKLESYLSNP